MTLADLAALGLSLRVLRTQRIWRATARRGGIFVASSRSTKGAGHALANLVERISR